MGKSVLKCSQTKMEKKIIASGKMECAGKIYTPAGSAFQPKQLEKLHNWLNESMRSITDSKRTTTRRRWNFTNGFKTLILDIKIDVFVVHRQTHQCFWKKMWEIIPDKHSSVLYYCQFRLDGWIKINRLTSYCRANEKMQKKYLREYLEVVPQLYRKTVKGNEVLNKNLLIGITQLRIDWVIYKTTKRM